MKEGNKPDMVKYLSNGMVIPAQLKEAIESYQLADNWAARLNVDIDKVREGARIISEFNGIPYKEALDRYGSAIQHERMKQLLAELPLVGQIFKNLALPPAARQRNREMRRRLKRELQKRNQRS